MQLLTRLHVLTYRNFWNTERSSLNVNSFALNNCFSYRNFNRLPMSALATVYSKCTAKIDFSIGYLCWALPYCWCWHWKSEVSPHIVWWVFGPHAGEIWTKAYGPKYTKFWAFWQKMVHHFWQSVDSIWKTFLWRIQLFDAKLLIQRLSSFSVPNITVRQV